MKATLKRSITSNQDLQFIQDAIQTALNQTTAYQPAAPSKWVSPSPNTLYDAIDRIAALLVTLNGGNAIP